MGQTPPACPGGLPWAPRAVSRAGCSPCSQLIPKVDGCRAAGLAQPAAERRDEKWLEKLESGQNLPRVAKGSRTKRGQTLRCSPSQKSLVFLLEMPSRPALPVLVCHVPCGSSDGDFAMCDPQEGLCVCVKGCRSSLPVPAAGFGDRNTPGLVCPCLARVTYPSPTGFAALGSHQCPSLTVPEEPRASQGIQVRLEAPTDPRNLAPSWWEL